GVRTARLRRLQPPGSELPRRSARHRLRRPPGAALLSALVAPPLVATVLDAGAALGGLGPGFGQVQFVLAHRQFGRGLGRRRSGATTLPALQQAPCRDLPGLLVVRLEQLVRALQRLLRRGLARAARTTGAIGLAAGRRTRRLAD